MAGNAGAGQPRQEHPETRCSTSGRHLPLLRLETRKHPLGPLSLQTPESPRRSDLREDQPPASGPDVFSHRLAPKLPILLPSLEEAGQWVRELEARRDWDTETAKTNLSPVFLGEESAM